MNVSNEDIAELFRFFATMKGDIDQYRDTHTALEALDRCTAMMSRDYLVHLVPNTFCMTYPKDLILLGHMSLDDTDLTLGEQKAHEQHSEKLKEMMEASRTCRCRQRIPVPVLVVRNKIIARSAGLSEALELAYEHGSMTPLNDPVAFRRRMIELDTKWLRTLLISDICDLMTEVKSGFLNVTLVNSEKGFKEYYDEGFALSAIPYPGVQYFKNYVGISGTGNYPVPPWHKWKLEPHIGRPMRLPSPYRWQEYKTWNQRELTQNIVRYLFSVLRDPKCSGMLLHCISGWDRTPHAISLVRILLWAEGEAHQSLNVDQMLYLTIAYDWFLFGHQLSHRLKKAHEIMFYTFDILGHLLSADFSLYLGDYVPPRSAKEAPRLRSQAEAEMASSSTDAGSTTSSLEASSSTSTDPTSIVSPNPTLVPSKTKVSMDEMLNQPINNLDLPTRIDARKHRLFELRDRFFYFYKTFIYPTYRK